MRTFFYMLILNFTRVLQNPYGCIWHVNSTLKNMIKNIEEVTCAFLQDIDLICFSHLRWAFVYQRPQHLLSRFAKHTRVFYVEEPIFADEEKLSIEHNNNVY